MKELVREGRLEFVTGGWIASDEACPTFNTMVDNIVTGTKFLNENFGIIPDIVWHADAFGHSVTNNYLFQLMGYKALFFGRLDD